MNAAITVTLVCGCVQSLGSDGVAPHCTAHDEHRVARVSAPPPRFRAVNCEASGPHVVKERA